MTALSSSHGNLGIYLFHTHAIETCTLGCFSAALQGRENRIEYFSIFFGIDHDGISAAAPANDDGLTADS